MKLNRALLTIAALIGVAFQTNVFAKEINLYDQPKADAKIIGTIDLAKGIVPIFTPKEGAWIKVGDPNNGSVGWVKQNDLSANTGSVNISQQFISTEQGPKTYVIKLSPPENLSPEQLKQMQQRQEILQQSLRSMTESINSLFQQNLKVPVQVPVLIPVMVPATSTSPAKTSVDTNPVQK